MSVMGTRVLRKEDPKFITVGGTYTADVDDPRLANAVHVTYVRSTMAHARITQIDVSETRNAPGVVGVYTADDLGDLPVCPPAVPLFPGPLQDRPHLAKDKVVFVGEPIVAVVTEQEYQGEDAAETVFVDYEPLDAVIDIEAALTDANVVHTEAGTNVMVEMAAMGMATGWTDDFMNDVEVVVKERIINQRVAACPLEVRSVATVWDDGKLVLWMSNQAPHGVMGGLQAMYGLEREQIQVLLPDVGGGFGPKISLMPEEGVLPFIAKDLGRPVRWTESRSENMMAMGHGRAQVQYVEIGGTKDGDVTHYRIRAIGDGGAYASMGGFLPFFTATMASGTYAIPNIETDAKSVVTNTMSTVAYRGAGRPEATAAVERAMDLFAAEIGMDPVEVRRKNLIGDEAFPFTTATGAVYDTGAYETTLDMALDAAGYADLRAEQARRREAGDTKLLGIGVSSYVEITAGPAPGGNEWGKVEVQADGKIKAYSGSFSHGQGHATSFAMLVADKLGVGVDDVEVVQGDTDQVVQGVGTFGSRSLQLGGSAVFEAAGQVVDRARELAAQLLEANADDVVLDTESGQFHVAGTPAVAKSWGEVIEANGGQGIEAEADFNGGATFPFGAHVIVVEVDSETGQVTVERVVTCDDSGTLLNPMLVEGQRHGGIAQGVAQALLEEVVYDDFGNPVTSNFADYSIISATELPSYELTTLETPTPNNPLGAKGIGESGAIGSTPAVQSAVVDAVSHLGIRHIDIPTTAEKVWRAIQDAS
jgi:carbon-monoxide dehydrogenase large subunit